jgi:hypothetical protein
MFSLFRRVLGLPTGLEHALLLLKAQNTQLVAHVTAAVAFLEAAESGGFESRREQPLSTEYSICGTRLSGAQDDLLRFATYTFLAEEYKDDVNDVKQLAQRINVTAKVLRRALGKYKKLEGQLTHRGSLEVIRRTSSGRDRTSFVRAWLSQLTRGCACWLVASEDHVSVRSERQVA